jgi:predicted helicase
MDFRLVSSYSPRGDQATAIDHLVRGLHEGEKHQVLLGVTGSGKTFTMAKVIERVNRSSILSVTTITTSLRLTSLRPTRISKKSRRSMTKSIGYDSRQRGPYSSGGMS